MAPTPGTDLEVSCSPASLSNLGCGSATCAVTGSRGFSGRVTLSCAGQPPGVNCGFGPNPVILGPDARVTTGLTVSAGPSAPQGPVSLRVVANGGGLERTTNLTLGIAGAVAPPPGRGMIAFGCAGYTAATLFPTQSFLSVYVGSWHDGPKGSFCNQTLGEISGAFTLEIPRSCRFAEGEPIYLTAGGLQTCVSVPYHAGTSSFVEILGRYTPCPQ